MNLSVKNGAVTINGETILECVNFDVKYGDHIAVVGRNGAGKTTLLRALMDTDLFEEGIGDDKFTITRYGQFNIGYLKQIDFEDESVTLADEVRKSFLELITMEKRLEEYVMQMEKDTNSVLIEQYSELLERFQLLGGYTYKKEYEVMLKRFGFAEEDKLKKIKEFSGGQKTKIAFIKLLLSKPDLLILDEPTNHLDIDTILWLEDYLKNYKGAIILVSHDRMFIDHVASIIYDIEYGRTVKYVGNYASYEKQKQQNYEKALSDYTYQQKEIKRLRTIYERFRFKPSKASLAMSRLHQLEKMDILEKPRQKDTKVFRTNLKGIVPSGMQVVTLKNTSFGYDQVLMRLNLGIQREMKIGVIGKNGIGKSTLLKTINGLIPPLGGKIVWGVNVKIGYFDQTLAMIDSHQTVLDEFCMTLPKLSVEQSRSALGSFLFKGDDVFKTIDVLSGGEKVRLQLCKILYDQPNFLILDEPTNHLDIIGKEHLESILEEYKGTVLFVSHDRYFIKKIATSLLVFESDGVHFYPYGYEEYLQKMKKKEEVICQDVKDNKIKKQETKKVNEYTVQKDLKKCEKEITQLEKTIKELQGQLYDAEVYMNGERMKVVTQNLNEAQEKLIQKNKEWENLANLLM